MNMSVGVNTVFYDGSDSDTDKMDQSSTSSKLDIDKQPIQKPNQPLHNSSFKMMIMLFNPRSK